MKLASRAVSTTVSIIGLKKRYGFQEVLKGIDLEVEAGECYALFGPNGAGKSTLLRILATRSQPTSGEVLLFGRRAHEVRGRIGVVLHDSFLRRDLTVEENLRFYGELFGVGDLRRRVEELMVRLDLVGHRRHEVRALSEGLEKRAAVARAILPQPDLLLLDEPFSGLDAAGVEVLEEIIGEYRNAGKTVLVVTHRIPLGCRLGGRGAVMRGGRIVYRTDGEDLDPAKIEKECL